MSDFERQHTGNINDNLGTTPDSQSDVDTGTEQGGNSLSSGVEKSLGSVGQAGDYVNAEQYYQNQVNNGTAGQAIEKSKEAEAKYKAAESARYVQQNATKGIESYTRAEYQAAQSVDKSGQTGGYVLDANRQMQYLRASIQADIFSQQELQKLGYESNLEQARWAAELEKDSLALQRYQAAEQIAISKAQTLGYYIAPQISDMMTQLNAAQSILAQATGSEEDYNDEQRKAKSVQDYVIGELQKYIDSNPGSGNIGANYKVTINGVKSLAAIESEANKAMAEAQQKYYETEAEKMKIEIAAAPEQTYDAAAGKTIPIFTDDGQLAGYGANMPTTDKQKQYLQDYYSKNPDAFNRHLNGQIQSMATQYAAYRQSEKDANRPEPSFQDFINKQYSGMSISALIKEYSGKDYKKGDRISLGGISLEMQEDGSWNITDGKSAVNDNSGNYTDIIIQNGGSNVGGNNTDNKQNVNEADLYAKATQVDKDIENFWNMAENHYRGLDLNITYGGNTYKVEVANTSSAGTWDKAPSNAEIGTLAVINDELKMVVKCGNDKRWVTLKNEKDSNTQCDSLKREIKNAGFDYKGQEVTTQPSGDSITSQTPYYSYDQTSFALGGTTKFTITDPATGNTYTTSPKRKRYANSAEKKRLGSGSTGEVKKDTSGSYFICNSAGSWIMLSGVEHGALLVSATRA